jgi:hypothetical protein
MDQGREYRDGVIDTMNTFQRHKYKARFTEENKVDIPELLYQKLRQDRHGMVGSTSTQSILDRQSKKYNPKPSPLITTSGYIKKY